MFAKLNVSVTKNRKGNVLRIFLSAGSLVVVKEPIEPLTSPFPYRKELFFN